MSSKCSASAKHFISPRDHPLGESSELLAPGLRIRARCVSQAQERICLVGGNWTWLGSWSWALFSPTLQRKEKSTSPLPSGARRARFPSSWQPVPCMQPGLRAAVSSMGPCPLVVPLKAQGQRRALFEAVRGWSCFLQLPSFLPLYFLLLPLPPPRPSHHPVPNPHPTSLSPFLPWASQGGLFPHMPLRSPGWIWSVLREAFPSFSLLGLFPPVLL